MKGPAITAGSGLRKGSRARTAWETTCHVDRDVLGQPEPDQRETLYAECASWKKECSTAGVTATTGALPRVLYELGCLMPVTTLRESPHPFSAQVRLRDASSAGGRGDALLRVPVSSLSAVKCCQSSGTTQ